MAADNKTITARGYSPRYTAAVEALLRTEGGFVDDPKDRGGATKFGISLRFLVAQGAFDDDGDGRRDFDLDMDGDIDGQDIRLLTRDGARYLYWRHFWKPLNAEELIRPLGEILFDQAVNGGARAACKMLQRAINVCIRRMGARTDKPGLLIVDGQIGPISHAAIGAVLRYPALGMPALIAAYRDEARNRYRAIVARDPSQKRFLAGWLNRADALGR